jgi:hypothetical protein
MYSVVSWASFGKAYEHLATLSRDLKLVGGALGGSILSAIHTNPFSQFGQ